MADRDQPKEEQPERSEKEEPAVEDLDVPEEEGKDVKGGSLNFAKIEYKY